ncbi:MAG TPA: ferrous iron transport protein B, partial [Spirochaetales bacterium]|nr:ferrous iron transport protein B [Spirochaetales bacterium]
EVEKVLDEARLRLERHFGRDAEIVVSERRYASVHGAVAESTRLAGESRFSLSEKADALLMSPLLGLPAFLLVMYGIFKLTFSLGAYPTAWLEALFSWLSGLAGSALPEGLSKSLVVDGILGGVGGVLSFVPPIVILFLCLSFLEDTGYMARAAFITDRFLHRFGLHGQSFLPLILGFGCSVPAIMSARTLKSRRDRVATVLAVPFMSCGAKLPVYVLLAGAFFPRNPAAAIMGVYGAGVVLALLSSLLLKRTILRGEATPFVMELPPYRLPTLRGILAHVGEKTGSYLRKAGTVILAASVLIWAVTTFPLAPEGATPDEALAYSAAGRAGKAVEPLLSPLGFDWKIGVAAVTGFAAKEVVVSTLGVLYRTDLDGSEAGPRGLAERLKEDSGMTPLVAFVLMLFVLVMPPCLAALAAIKAELGWRWLAFEAAYLAALSWALAFLVYRGGLLLGLGA